MRDALASLQLRMLARARMTPAPDAVALVIGRQVCGSLSPAVARCIAGALPRFRHGDTLLELDDDGQDAVSRSLHLEAAARLLLQEGYSRAWRDEQLEVRPHPDAAPLACIDRSAVRVLGITTYSVHLNGFRDDGQLIVARRAAHKRVDPLLWDNLAGGMIAAGEDVRVALAREAHEEAGIRLSEYPVRPGARFSVRRPIPEGVLAEQVHVFDVQLPDVVAPVNLDDEVDCFEVRPVPAVLAGIERGEFTVESALATLDGLLRRA